MFGAIGEARAKSKREETALEKCSRKHFTERDIGAGF